MKMRDDDDFAFPRPDQYSPDGMGAMQGWSGMTLRDYFAARAMDRMISLCEDADGGWDYDTVAEGCYRLADAMLRARKD